MKMKIVVISLTMLIIIVGLGAASLVPYHFYKTTLEEGVVSEYLNVTKPKPSMIKGSVTRIENSERNIFTNQNLWGIFHFRNYVVPLPTHHPQVILIPRLQVASGGDRIGASFLERSGKEIFAFIELDSFSFQLELDKEKIFSLPVVRKKILENSAGRIWKDIFSLDLTPVAPSLESGFLNWWKHSVDDLLYRLFILHMRQHMFSKYNPTHLSFIENKNFGIMRYPDIDERFVKENVYIFLEGVIYVMEIRYQKFSERGETLRDRYIEILTQKPTSHDAALQIYADYRLLPYHKRIRQEGFAYLYAGWSHSMEHEDFLKEMIHFLERGRNNIQQLTPLYDYGSRKFGTSFSKDKTNLEKFESADARVKRKAGEELKGQIRELENSDKVIEDGEFESEEERMLFYLKQVKEKNINTDEEEKVLER